MSEPLDYKQLIARNIRNDAVLQSIGDGLIVIIDVDKGGKIVYVNSVFEDMTGWKAEEVLDKSIVKVLPREDAHGKVVPFVERIVSRVLSRKKVVADLTQPFYYVRKDKSRFPVASVITPIILDKKVVGAVETFRDISKESAADKAKTEFASLVSHQLRTPFATINWYVELLLSEDSGSLNEKQRKYLQEVYKASKRMVDLVNVLLSVSRIEMGVTEIDEKAVDVVALARTIVKEEKPHIQEKGLKVEELYDKDVPRIIADPKQIAIILQNLFSNAIKYSLEEGKISLTIGRKGTDILVTVADSGIGIPEADQSKIFSRFFRAENAKERDPEGVGLGLYIVKAVIDMMHGKIWCESYTKEESQPAGRQGTTFYVTVPIKKLPKREREN